MSKKLTDFDYCNAAEDLGCGVPIMKAVAETESAGDGYLGDGRIKIRFEGHKFKGFTGGKYDGSHPRISYPYKVQRSKPHGYEAFNEAFALEPTVALLATSWGKFQPMGFTHDEAGFDDVHEFVEFLKISEGNQLLAFCALVKHRGLADELRRGTLADCATFARLYNGASYKDNNYDTKIFHGKEKYAKQKIDCSKVHPFTNLADEEINSALGTPAKIGNEKPAADDSEIEHPQESASASPDLSNGQPVNPPPKVEPQDEVTKTQTVDATGAVKESVQVTTKNEQDVNKPAQVSSTTYQGVGLFGVLKKDFAVVTGGNLSFQGLQEYATQASGWPPWVISLLTKAATIAIIAGVGWLVYRLIHYIVWKIGDWQRMKVEANINSDVTRKNIEWT